MEYIFIKITNWFGDFIDQRIIRTDELDSFLYQIVLRYGVFIKVYKYKMLKPIYGSDNLVIDESTEKLITKIYFIC